MHTFKLSSSVYQKARNNNTSEETNKPNIQILVSISIISIKEFAYWESDLFQDGDRKIQGDCDTFQYRNVRLSTKKQKGGDKSKKN